MFVCLGLASPVFGADLAPADESHINDGQFVQTNLPQVIAQAITQYEQTSRQDWSYRISRYENEEGDISSSIELFDPAKDRNNPWTLLSVNGQLPSIKQQQKFAKNKQQVDDAEQRNFSLKLRDIIQIDSLQLISEEQTTLQASFNVFLSQLGEEATENLRGLLIFDKAQQFIETIEITNTGVFSPVFGAQISEFKLTFRFIKIDTAILPKQHELVMKGSFAFFTKIEETSSDIFTDYRYVGSD